jgi:hypothetical protein
MENPKVLQFYGSGSFFCLPQILGLDQESCQDKRYSSYVLSFNDNEKKFYGFGTRGRINNTLLSL